MRKGAQAAADALGVELVFQGAPDFNPVTQVPVLDAVIARGSFAILIAPTDTTQLVEPLRKANDAGIPVITVDTFIGTRQVPDRRRRCRLPALLHRLRQRAWRPHGGARARRRDRRRRQGLRLQREAWHLDHRPARGRLQGREGESFPKIEVLETQFNDNDANKAASQLQAVFARNADLKGVFGANLFSALGAANGVSRPARAARSRSSPSTRRPRSSTTSTPVSSTWRSPSIRPRSAITAWSPPSPTFRGQSIPTSIGTGFTVIDKANVADPNVAKYIYSD